MSIRVRMTKILESKKAQVEEEGTESAGEMEVAKHIALAATAMGIDLDDNEAIDSFITQVKNVVTKDKAKLKSLLKRFTTSKAKQAAKGTVKAVS